MWHVPCFLCFLFSKYSSEKDVTLLYAIALSDIHSLRNTGIWYLGP